MNGNYQQAEQLYVKAIALSKGPDLVSVGVLFTFKAICNFWLKKYPQCVEDCSNAIKCDPNDFKAHLYRSCSYACMKDYAKAAEDCERAYKLLQFQPGYEKLRPNLIKTREKIAELRNNNKKTPEPDWIEDFGIKEVPNNIEPNIKTETKSKDFPVDILERKGSPPGLPLLTPIGEVADKHLDDIIGTPQAETQAIAEKEQGNKSFQQFSHNYLAALVHYSNAIKLNPKEAVFYSNRALVYLKLNRFFEAINDCTASIDRNPTWKAFARRAAAWAALKEYALAAEDCKRALRFEPSNKECLQELQKCLHNIEEEYNKSNQENPNSEKSKKLRLVKEDIKKFCKSSGMINS